MKQFFLLILTIGTLTSSCKKEGCTNPLATNYDVKATKDDGSCSLGTLNIPTNYTPRFNAEYGALIAVNTISTNNTLNGDVDTKIGSAFAVFSQNGGQNFNDAGTLTVNEITLNKQENNAYLYNANSSNPNGLIFGSTVNWKGSGATWSAFDVTTSQGFATVSPISSGNINLTSDYVVKATDIQDADSILFSVIGKNATISKMTSGGTNTSTFSTTELSTLGTGLANVQIIGIKYDYTTIDSKPCYLINETVRNKSVRIE